MTKFGVRRVVLVNARICSIGARIGGEPAPVLSADTVVDGIVRPRAYLPRCGALAETRVEYPAVDVGRVLGPVRGAHCYLREARHSAVRSYCPQGENDRDRGALRAHLHRAGVTVTKFGVRRVV